MVRKLTPSELKQMKKDFLKWFNKAIYEECLMTKHESYDSLNDDNWIFKETTYAWFDNYLRKLLKTDKDNISEFYLNEIDSLIKEVSPELKSITQKNWLKSKSLKSHRVRKPRFGIKKLENSVRRMF